MKRLWLCFLTLAVMQAQAQQTMQDGQASQTFPRSAIEDKDGIMSEAYWKLWNPDVQARIDADIEANRKADAVLHLHLPTGTEVSIEQISSDFYFGGQFFNYNQLGSHENNERYKQLFVDLFNSATIPFFWRTFEMQPGRLRFVSEYWDTEEYWNQCSNRKQQPHFRRPATDEVVRFCEQHGLRMHGHTMLWGNRDWGFPEWLYTQTNEKEQAFIRRIIADQAGKHGEMVGDHMADLYQQMSPEALADSLPEFARMMKEQFALRIKRLAQHYGGRIQSWDVVNESAVDARSMHPGGLLMKSKYGLMPADYTYEAFQVAQRMLPPHVWLNTNDYDLTVTYANQVADLLHRGCRVDVMGAQMHLFNPQDCVDIANGRPIQTPEQVWEWAKRLSATGCRLHLSEITITAPGDSLRGRLMQAVIAQNLYRLWFSLPAMSGITWWNFTDLAIDDRRPQVAGLIDRRMLPKPAYYALHRLIHQEWRTKLQVRTGKKDIVRFRGFRGRYRVSWTDADGNIVTREFHLANDGDGLD